MYTWIWRHLPGRTGTKAVLSLLLVLVAISFLMLVVFPWLEPRLPVTPVTVDAAGPAPTP